LLTFAARHRGDKVAPVAVISKPYGGTGISSVFHQRNARRAGHDYLVRAGSTESVPILAEALREVITGGDIILSLLTRVS
jgi:hypothetical protein